MKLLLWALLLVGLIVPTNVWAQEAFTITSFHVDLAVQEDGAVLVEEQITADFGTNERHGIFRTIPVRYQAPGGATRSIRVDQMRVQANGADVPYQQSRERSDLVVKIGDPNAFVSGIQEYGITYRVQNALNGFADHDELYWNATGNGWQTSIDQASARVTLPAASEGLNAQSYQGASGSQEAAESEASGSTFTYQATRQLSAGEGLTVVAGWPKGLVSLPSATQKFLWFVRDNGILALPLFVLAWLVWQFQRRGKDPLGRRTVVPEFAPPKTLTLLEQAALADERLQTRDLTALIVSWAVDGFLTIEEPTKGQYELVRRKALVGRSDAEHRFFDALFVAATNDRVAVKELGGTLASAASTLRTAIFSSLVKRGYFTANPETVRVLWIVGGVIVMVPGFFLQPLFGWPGIVAFVVSGLLIMAAAPFMPRRTAEGVKAKEQVDGFQLYLRTAERYRAEFAEKAKLFESYLPYAIAFGVATLWAKAFRDIATEPPTWYSGYYGSHWIASDFAHGLEGGMNSGMAGAVTTASSGGSGFSGGGSGGGFGGGGGGSW